MKRFVALFLCLSLLLCGCGGAETDDQLSPVLEETAAVLLEKVPSPTPGSVGGEWTVFGMSRWGGNVPAGWHEGYEALLNDYVTRCGGVLHERKYTEYSRVILAVTAMGSDAADVAGFDLTAPLEDFEQTVFQGVNGAIYALLALDAGGYGSDTIRERYVTHILEKELPGGGWTLMGDTPEADLTAMALQALAKYRSREDVSAAVDRGLEVLSGIGYETSESVSQAIVALTELGISIDDARFVSDGRTLLDLLLEYRNEDGMFRHMSGPEGDLLATEQAFYALVSLALAREGGSLYQMQGSFCTLEIRCDTLLSRLEELEPGKAALVPEDGVLLEQTRVEFEPGESVFDVFRRCLREEGLHFEYVDARAYDSVYIEGIGNLYEFDCGEKSGWMFCVNGVFPGLGCSGYTVSEGDEIVFAYTCDLGADLGAEK